MARKIVIKKPVIKKVTTTPIRNTTSSTSNPSTGSSSSSTNNSSSGSTSNNSNNSNNQQQDCTQQCVQVIEEKKLECSAPKVQNSLAAVLGAMTSVIDSLKNIEDYTKALSDDIQEITKVAKHYHDSHLHTYAHDGTDQYDVPMGKAILPTPNTPADKVMTEYNTNVDMDGNGLIYGKDFVFKTTSEIPRVIQTVNDKLLRENTIKTKMTFDAYLKSVPNADKLWTR